MRFNLEFEDKLTTLRQEAERIHLTDARIVLTMLEACIKDGKAQQFAKHCVAFSDLPITLTPCLKV
jgi:hypothetical protein